jgi:hypothetical protein
LSSETLICQESEIQFAIRFNRTTEIREGCNAKARIAVHLTWEEHLSNCLTDLDLASALMTTIVTSLPVATPFSQRQNLDNIIHMDEFTAIPLILKPDGDWVICRENLATLEIAADSRPLFRI